MMKRYVLLFSAAMLAASALQARIDAPDHVIYGNASIFGNPAPSGEVVEARWASTGEVLARYELGRDPRLADQFALRIPMDAVNPQLEGFARPGEPIRIFISDMLAAETTVGGEGRAVRLDIDPQALGSGPSIAIEDAELFEGNSGTTAAVFAASLNTTSGDPVSVSWTTEDATATGGATCGGAVDYIANDDTLLFAPGDVQGSITVEVCGDTEIEATEHFRVKFTGYQNGVLSRSSVTGTIVGDDDVPEVRLADVAVQEPAQGVPAEAVFRPRLSKRSDFEARFDFRTEPLTATPGVHYESTSGQVVIPADSLEAEIRVNILHYPQVSEPLQFRLDLSDKFNVTFERDGAIATITDPAHDPALDHVQDIVNGEDGITGLAGPTALALAPGNEHVYVTSEPLDAVVHFERDHATGRLALSGVYDDTAPSFEAALMVAPMDVTVSPDGGHVYIAAKNSKSIVVASRNATTGELTFVENRTDGTGGVAGLDGVRRLVVSPDGQHVYAAGADANAVAVFSRDSATGQLTFLEAEVDNQDDPDDPGGAVVAMTRPAGLALSGAGEQLYVASRFGNAVQVFVRDTDSSSPDFGRLSFDTAYQDDLAGISGLQGAFGIAVSDGDEHVYVSAEGEAATVLFDRNGNGTLDQRAIWQHQMPDRAGLQGAQGLALSPDGMQVYVTGYVDGSLTIFDRVQPDGEGEAGDLDVRQTLFDGEGDVENMAGPTSVAVSEDGRHVYVVARDDNAIIVLRRIWPDPMFSDSFHQLPLP